ncbi:MAG: carboxynorspermidine decarboxylase [Clostridiales bacterium]|nr:carboxynorspermidine decarboxylase [Clostridiales bacterium]
MKRDELKTPCYVVMEHALKKNLEILAGVRKRTGCKILLAQKAFSMFSCYSLIGKYLDGTAASGLYEARLGAEEMRKETHIFSAAYKEEEMEEILSYCGHIVFNSFSQLERYGKRVAKAGKSVGIRVNPECSTQGEHAIYDPCTPGSRLGVLAKEFPDKLPQWVEGIHFHTLCEQNADALAVTLEAVERKFGPWLSDMKWINFGGGHHITRKDYDIELLEKCIRHMSDAYGIQVYLEPGEAVALNAGHLLTTVEDLVHDDKIAILDTSAACHMPDVIEMPYRPPLMDSAAEGEKAFSYMLGGPTCLAGDMIGSYSFDRPLKVGDRLTFEDMAIYTMVKNNTFNGVPLPSIVWEKEDGECEIIKAFDYKDFKERL